MCISFWEWCAHLFMIVLIYLVQNQDLYTLYVFPFFVYVWNPFFPSLVFFLFCSKKRNNTKKCTAGLWIIISRKKKKIINLYMYHAENIYIEHLCGLNISLCILCIILHANVFFSFYKYVHWKNVLLFVPYFFGIHLWWDLIFLKKLKYIYQNV